MDYTPDQRAIEVLGDYLYELETNDRKRCRSWGKNRTIADRAKPEPPPANDSTFDKAQEYLVGVWERRQLKIWGRKGRITADGFLRVGRQPLKPYKLADIARIMPHLRLFDQVAALIDLNGVVPRGFMNAHENIRAVVQTISREEVEKVLETDEAKARIADIVHEQVGVIFGGLFDKLKSQGGSIRSHGKKQRCSRCGVPGHRAKKCTMSEEEAIESKKKTDAEVKAEKERGRISS